MVESNVVLQAGRDIFHLTMCYFSSYNRSPSHVQVPAKSINPS